jgi:Do/DeqQ family serine protease
VFLKLFALLASNLFSATNQPSPSLIRAAEDFSRVAELADPWVVNISTSQIIRQRVMPFWNPFFEDPFAPTQEFRRQSLGSGVVLSTDGEVLTNAHVVADADEIKVRLIGGEEYPAAVLGEDENVDLAVLRIKPKKTLVPAVLGDSSRVKVGEWAIAIGNPFGFDHSVTVGVISAKERSNVLGEQEGAHYQNFLQTDASINHGNSGGPLCNIRGEVIGINSAISTPNEGSIGIGFAIPINMVKRAVPDLIKSGHVVTPKLGFFTQDMDERMAAALKLGDQKGVLVSDVVAGSPADKAGIKRMDLLLSFNLRPVANSSELKSRLYEIKPGDNVNVVVLRKGERLGLNIITSSETGHERGWHGLEVEENNTEKARSMGLAVARGVIVSKVSKGSSASKIGINPGDVIVEINQQRLDAQSEWTKMTRDLGESSDVILLLVRGQQSAYVVLPAEVSEE